jgi:hypothetical protein
VSKLLLMSVLLATAIIPAAAARDELPRRGLRRAILAYLAFNLVYAVLVILVYPKICWT